VHAAEEIRARWHELKVRRIHARTLAAQMVNGHPSPGRERHAMREHVREAVGIFIDRPPLRLAKAEDPIARRAGAVPKPARRRAARGVDFCPKALEGR